METVDFVIKFVFSTVLSIILILVRSLSSCIYSYTLDVLTKTLMLVTVVTYHHQSFRISKARILFLNFKIDLF